MKTELADEFLQTDSGIVTAMGHNYLTADLELLDSVEVCRLLGVSRGWLNDHATGRRRPIISSLQMGKLRRFREKDIAAFIEECRRIGQAKPTKGRASQC